MHNLYGVPTNVMVNTHAKNGIDGKMYKTEVSAFIEKFMKYDEAFGEDADADKPEIVIILNKSKKGNTYVNFDLVEQAD